MFKEFDINNFNFTKYLFFTGKGGSGEKHQWLVLQQYILLIKERVLC